MRRRADVLVEKLTMYECTFPSTIYMQPLAKCDSQKCLLYAARRATGRPARPLTNDLPPRLAATLMKCGRLVLNTNEYVIREAAQNTFSAPFGLNSYFPSMSLLYKPTAQIHKPWEDEIETWL